MNLTMLLETSFVCYLDVSVIKNAFLSMIDLLFALLKLITFLGLWFNPGPTLFILDREKRIKSHEVTNINLIFQLVSGHARPSSGK